MAVAAASQTTLSATPIVEVGGRIPLGDGARSAAPSPRTADR
jgi:hypothetical protein